MLDTSLEQYVGRLSHDRTTERHWQRLGSHRATVPKEVPCGSSTPAAAHATSPRAVAVRLSSVPFHREGRPCWSGGLSLPPLPPRTLCRKHRRIAPTVHYRRKCGTGQTPGPFLVSRHLLFRGSRPLLAVSGSSRRWPACCRQVTLVGDAIAGARGPVPAPQSPCPGSPRRQGSHLPYTSVGLLR